MTRSGTPLTRMTAPSGLSEGAKSWWSDGLANHRHERGAALVFGADAAAGGDLPIGDRRVVGGNALDEVVQFWLAYSVWPDCRIR